jgi:ABC-2 type transport system ATP-binding protein
MIISGNSLSKTYGKLKVLDNVSISCGAGEICGLLGSNGAGKTTLFKILFGLVTPDSGNVEINSDAIKPMGGIIEKPALYEYLNAYDNLKIFASIQGVAVTPDFLASTLSKVGLPLDRKDPVRNFSMGMKQRLGIAIALLNNPKCLVLDEPFTGLDPLGVASLRKLIVDLAEKENLAVILSSHIIEELSKICHTLYVLKEGRMVNTGPAEKIIAGITTAYTICAENISTSKILETYEASFKGDCALVSIGAERISELIRKLQQEGVYITSCIPELSMKRLFETESL